MFISSTDIRNQFITFFKEKRHQFIRSSSVLPNDDPTLLFTNAGMNQFKPYFIGKKINGVKRVVNSQKCIRVSGKHNDLEEVGVDEYHHTFFEMLGNWSFGDYYKKEAIVWAWELLTEIWQLDKKRLWVTIFKDDDESGKLWKENTDIEHGRIIKFGHKENFWEMGDTGPCGPCTEIHYYIGKEIENQSSEGVNVLPEYREIWNLVFIQFNRDKEGKLKNLPEKHVDTGAGLERLVSILNGKSSNYDTDLFIPILNAIVNISGKKNSYKNGVPHRVIADHLRMLSFSIADGAMPSNDGRGYVLRRVLRRASRYGRMLEMKEPFIFKLVDVLCSVMGEAFPELIEKKKHIESVIKSEENSFNNTLDRGLEEYAKIIKKMQNKGVINGESAFKLYDTFGFPLDLTILIAKDDGISVDSLGFNECMLKQKKLAQNSSKFINIENNVKWEIRSELRPTEFFGYSEYTLESELIKYRKSGEKYQVVLDKTPFYGESGGQIGDSGYLTNKDFLFHVEDVQKVDDEYIHIGEVKSGNIDKIDTIIAKVDEERRNHIKRNHTATHILHQALKEVLGDHVQQAGSLVSVEFLRFDLTHYEKITEKQIEEIEFCINSIIMKNQKVQTELKSYSNAKNEGAISLFGEKYDEMVRVVEIKGFSKELCGGTHVNRTGEIGCLRINSESALSTGVRRLVAYTGLGVHNLLNVRKEIINKLKHELTCNEDEIIKKLQSLLFDKKKLDNENNDLKQLQINTIVDNLVSKAITIGKSRVVISELKNIGDLRSLGDDFRKKFITNGISLIGTIQNKKPVVMCSITDDLVSKIKASNIARKIGSFMQGGGGGKDHIATAGGSDIVKLNPALEYGKKIIEDLLRKA